MSQTDAPDGAAAARDPHAEPTPGRQPDAETTGHAQPLKPAASVAGATSAPAATPSVPEWASHPHPSAPPASQTAPPAAPLWQAEPQTPQAWPAPQGAQPWPGPLAAQAPVWSQPQQAAPVWPGAQAAAAPGWPQPGSAPQQAAWQTPQSAQTPHQAPGQWSQPGTGFVAQQTAAGQPAPQPRAIRSADHPVMVGPFTLREGLILLAGLLSAVLSLLPLVTVDLLSVWQLPSDLFLTTLLPVTAAVLVLVRRLRRPSLRVGSFGVDQLAAVAAVGAVIGWIDVLAVLRGYASATPVFGVIVSLGLVVLTCLAPIVPGLRQDFLARPSLQPEAFAQGARPVDRQPRPADPAAAGAASPAAPAHAAPGVPAAPSVGVASAPMPSPAPASAFAPSPAASPAHTTPSPAPTAAADTRALHAPAATDVLSSADPSVSGALPAEASSAPAQGSSAHAPLTVAWDELTDGLARAAHTPTPSRAHAATGDSNAAQSVEADERAADSVAWAPLQGQTRTAEQSTVRVPTASERMELSDASVSPWQDAAPATATTNAAQAAAGTQPSEAFWALVPEDRPIFDEHGAVQFHIGPTAWVLVIQDRGDALVVRHDDGRVGYLTDMTGVIRS